MKKDDLVGEVFGHLTVKQLHSTDRNGHTRWSCLCSCGNSKDILGTNLKNGQTVSCGCFGASRAKELLGEYVGDISGGYWHNHIVRSANGEKRRKVPLSITKEYAWQLFLNQGKRCALSGVSIYFPTKSKAPYTASLDRIDSSLGYVEGNVQWVHKDINMMKRIYDNSYFIEMCKKVADFNR